MLLPGALSVTSTLAPLLMVTADPVTGLMPAELFPVKVARSFPALPRVSVLVNASGVAARVPLMTEGVAMEPSRIRIPALVETVRLPPLAMEPVDDERAGADGGGAGVGVRALKSPGAGAGLG